MIERPYSQKEILARQAMNRRIERFGNVLIVIIIGLGVALLIATMGRDANASTVKKPMRMSVAHASCYELFGNTTANGTTVTRRTIGVAHRSLPFGTRVWIKSNGRSVVAKVIDRGPFVRGRTFDLTHGAARHLGYRTPTPCRHFGHRDIQYAILRRR